MLRVLLCLSLCAAVAAQPPAADPPKPGAIEGRVLNAKSGEPLRRATMTLRLSNAVGFVSSGPSVAAAPYTATTDADGKFRIDTIEPGSYRLTAARQGFLQQEYGARRPRAMGTIVKIAASQELKALEIKLTPQAVLTGRVLDEEGEPMARVQIQTLRQSYFQGKKRMLPFGGGMTSDTGEYRVAELPPGRYFVYATWRGQMGMMGDTAARNPGDKPEEAYAPTYYPGTTDVSAARAVETVAGQELPGIDFRLNRSRVYRVRGKVAGATPRNLRLMVVPRDRDAAMMGFYGGMGALVKDDGSFEIGNVHPGAYFVTTVPMGPTQNAMGKVAVDVARENVENITLTLGPGATLTGAIKIEGEAPAALSNVRIYLAAIEGMAFNAPNGVTKEDGSFTLENIGAEKYRVNVNNLPAGTWLKSIRLGEQEVLDSGVDFSAGANGSLQVVLGRGGGQVQGVVQDAKQEPVPGAMVTLLPDPMREERYDLQRTTTADQHGQFNMEGLPPGEYTIYAWDDIEMNSHMDPEFRKPHEGKAQKVSVKVNSSQQLTLPQIQTER